jgi:hypothetical protein
MNRNNLKFKKYLSEMFTDISDICRTFHCIGLGTANDHSRYMLRLHFEDKETNALAGELLMIVLDTYCVCNSKKKKLMHWPGNCL